MEMMRVNDVGRQRNGVILTRDQLVPWRISWEESGGTERWV